MTANRLQLLAHAKRTRKWLVPFFTAGFPSVEKSTQLILTAVEAGADIVEIGIPFSDPLADGPAIQFASHESLVSGMTLSKLFEIAKDVRARTSIPILFMGYVNPMMAYGLSRFVGDCVEAGVDGLIVPDLPLDESADLASMCTNSTLSLIQLVAPTSPLSRVKQLAAASPDLLYAVTVAGVTGARTSFGSETKTYLARVKKSSKGPVVAGFGVSSAETAKSLAETVDGVVVGSALVEIIRGSANTTESLSRVGDFLRELRASLDQLSV